MSVSSMFELRARVWDRAAPSLAGVEKRTLSGHSGWVKCCAFSPDGQSVLSGSDDNTLKIWSASDGSERYTLSGHSHCVTSCSFSPDGASVLSGSADETLKIWDAATGARLRSALRLHLIS